MYKKVRCTCKAVVLPTKGLFTWAQLAGLARLPGRIFASGLYEKFQLGFRNEIRPNILATSSGAKCEKASKHGETQKSETFRAYHSFGNSYGCITAVKWMLMMWKIQRATQDDAIRAARVHPGNRAELHIWQNFSACLPRSRLEKPRSREPTQPALSYEHIENITKDLEVRRVLGKRASPVNRAHVKRP